MGDVTSPTATLARQSLLTLASLLVAASCRGLPAAESFDSRAVATLGARDGYLFVFSPFNCALRAPQITALNALSERSRRSGRVLSIGHELADSVAARQATEGLGIRLVTGPLASTRLGASGGTSGLRTPLAIAIRDGRVVSVLSGSDTQRIDSWIEWIEHR